MYFHVSLSFHGRAIAFSATVQSTSVEIAPMCNLIIARKSLCRERFVSTQLNYEHNYQNRFSSPLSSSCYVFRPAYRQFFMWRYLNTFALQKCCRLSISKVNGKWFEGVPKVIAIPLKLQSPFVSQQGKSSSKQVRRYKQIRFEVAHNEHLDLCPLVTIQGQLRCLWVSWAAFHPR